MRWLTRCLLILCLPALAWSQGAEVPAMRVSVGFGGTVVPARWQPLHVELDRPVAQAVLEIRRERASGGVPGIERLPLGQAMACDLPVFVDESSRKLSVSLLVDGELLARRVLAPLDRVFTGHLILADGLGVAEQTALGRVLFPREPVLVVPVQAARLPASVYCLDAVSVLVIREPRPGLSPAQLTALRQWLAGGGRLLLGCRPGSPWLAELCGGGLLPVADAPGRSGSAGAMMSYGLGRVITVWPAGAAPGGGQTPILDDTADWRRWLDLPDFESAARLSPGLGFKRAFDRPAGLKAASLADSFPLVWVAAWLLPALGACFLRKSRLKVLAPLSLLGLAAMAVLWHWQAPAWQKGAILHGRALILPAQAGVLISENLWFPETGADSRAGFGFSPWGLAVRWREAGDAGVQAAGGDWGSLVPDPDDSPVWNHGSARAALLLRSATARGWNLNGVVPASQAPRREASGSLVRFRLEAGRLRCLQREPATGRWLATEELPREFRGDLDWIRHLAGLVPGEEWEFGCGSLSGPGLELDGQARRMVCWARPLAGEVR